MHRRSVGPGAEPGRRGVGHVSLQPACQHAPAFQRGARRLPLTYKPRSVGGRAAPSARWSHILVPVRLTFTLKCTRAPPHLPGSASGRHRAGDRQHWRPWLARPERLLSWAHAAGDGRAYRGARRPWWRRGKGRHSRFEDGAAGRRRGAGAQPPCGARGSTCCHCDRLPSDGGVGCRRRQQRTLAEAAEKVSSPVHPLQWPCHIYQPRSDGRATDSVCTHQLTWIKQGFVTDSW